MGDMGKMVSTGTRGNFPRMVSKWSQVDTYYMAITPMMIGAPTPLKSYESNANQQLFVRLKKSVTEFPLPAFTFLTKLFLGGSSKAECEKIQYFNFMEIKWLVDADHYLTVVLSNVLQYVPEELLPVYQEHIIPLADVITPNQFEAE